ncbi:hypothetical protein BJ085DRAFT_22053, partial [Dimargaris cristalligena]
MQTAERDTYGITVDHQKVVLDIDIAAHSLFGFTELTAYPHSDTTRLVRLNCRQSRVTRVTVAGQDAEFKQQDAYDNLQRQATQELKGIEHHRELRRTLQLARRESDDGELVVLIPDGVPITPIAQPDSVAAAAAVPSDSPRFNTLVIRVDFQLIRPAAGLVFSGSMDDPGCGSTPSSSSPPILYTQSDMVPGQARLWLPCVDQVNQRCTWELTYIVPRRLTPLPDLSALSVSSSSAEPTGSVRSGKYSVVSSGELLEQTIHPNRPDRKIFSYQLQAAAPPCSLAFVVGPFRAVRIDTPHFQNGHDNGSGSPTSTVGGIYLFAAPGAHDDLVNTCRCLPAIMDFFCREYGSYPFSSYKVVFIDELARPVIAGASLTILDSELLYPPDIIDQTYETRRLLSLVVAEQWFGQYITPKAWSDTWLIGGLAHHLAGLFLKHHFGTNEYLFRLKKDMERLVELDVHQPPICNAELVPPFNPDTLAFVQFKAPLVLYILDKRMMKGGLSLGLHRVIPKILLSAMSGDLDRSYSLGTTVFLKMCRKLSGLDVKSFAEQWVYGSGCPIFHFTYQFNRKKLVVEIHMRQEWSNQSSRSESAQPSIRPYATTTPIFTGQMTARIREADGTPYEHVLDIEESSRKFEVQFNTKYKRIRRNTKRFQMRQAAAAAEEANVNQIIGLDTEEAEEQLALFGGDDEEEKRTWRIVEWGEEDEESLASSTFEWIRLDSDMEWLGRIHFAQPDFMWAAQLQKDRDVVAQYEAIQALRNQPSSAASTSLMRVVMDVRMFYRVRMEAARALPQLALPHLDYIGLYHLRKVFERRYCVAISGDGTAESANPTTTAVLLPQPNNFDNMSEYFVQRAIILAMAEVRDQNHRASDEVREFLLRLLKFNDNSDNEYADCYYIGTIITALVNTVTPSAPGSVNADVQLIVDEVERFRVIDALLSTYHNTITVTCLEALYRLCCLNVLPFDLPLFLHMTRHGNFRSIRQCATKILLDHFGVQPRSPLLAYLLHMVTNDPDLAFRHFLSQQLLWCLVRQIQKMGEPLAALPSFHIDEGTGSTMTIHGFPDGDLGPSVPQLVDQVRQTFKNDDRTGVLLWQLLSTSLASLDPQIQADLFALSELLYRSIDPLPSLPPTAVVGPPPPVLAHPPPSRLASPPLVPPSPPVTTIHSTPTPRPASPALIVIPKLKIKLPSSGGGDGGSSELASPNLPPNIASKERPTPMTPLPPPAPVTPNRGPFSRTLSADQKKQLKRLLRKIMASRSAYPFLQPVDPVRDGCPTYFQFIKEPMDLGTMKRKLDTNRYTSLQQFHDDFHLVINNCYLFNPIGTFVYTEGQEIESMFEQEWSEAFDSLLETAGPARNYTIVEIPRGSETALSTPSRPSAAPSSGASSRTVTPVRPATGSSGGGGGGGSSGASDEVARSLPYHAKHILKLLRKLQGHPSAQPFLQPVDPIALGIPHYRDVIRHPIDLGTIERKIQDNHSYQDYVQVRKDVQLMLDNCFTFNPPNSYVYNEGKTLEKLFTKLWGSLVKELLNRTRPTKTPVGDSPAAAVASPTPAFPTAKSTPVQVATPTPAPKVVRMDPDDVTRCESVLDKLQSSRFAALFLQPVHPERDGCPTYFQKIKHPMDLGTIGDKLTRGRYSQVEQFRDDIELMLHNCFLFNPPGTYAREQGQSLKAVYHKLWKNGGGGGGGSMDSATRGRVTRLLQKLSAHRYAGLFLQPVDPVRDGVPNYLDIVKHPMDLGTIAQKLARPPAESYPTLDAFVADVELVFSNCYLYN